MIPQGAAVSRGLEALPTRPPTPPREKQSDADPKQLLVRHPLNSRVTLHTPPNYSPDSADSTNPSSRRTRKKVEFTVQAEYREAPTYADKENAHKQSTPVSSAASSRPVKSILKQSSSPAPPNPLDPSAGSDEANRRINLSTMLASTIKQIAGADRDSKLDAYMLLVRALRASNSLPDRIALQDKMSLFMQFIQRDVTTKGPNGNLDSSLVNHALTLLITFLHFPAIASTLSPDFGVFIVDHCIRSFEDHSTPKDVARHLMQVVTFQDFPPKVMTVDRVGRLVASLHKIEEHLQGKSIIMSRLLIYRRLIKQSRTHMVIHSDWLLDLFTDMLSSMKEIRAAAIALGLEASFTVGKEKQLSRRVMEILQLTADETRYIEYYVQRLMAMAKEKQDSAAVPQIWSVVILLLRCPVDRWEFFAPWLEIIQKCFNSGDYHTKIEANYAWNRLVYALQLHESSFSKTIGTVCQPFISQLKRKVTSKQLEELRKVVIGSVCNLYYYAFKPNSSSAQLDSYWDSCVRPLMQQLTSSGTDGKSVEELSSINQEGLTQAALILTGLFNSSTPRLWKEDRIAENVLVSPDDLPALDPKWVRRNAPRVFLVVETILRRTFLTLSYLDSSSLKLWRSLVGAVAAAASKEVKVSTDTAAFVAHAFGLLLKIWTAGPSDPSGDADTYQRFLDATEKYLVTMVDSLGLLPFTEKLLSMNKQNAFIPIATPSRRPGKGQGLIRAPLHHLFAILSALPPTIPDSEGLSNLIKTVFSPFALARSPRAGRDLAQELIQTLPADGPCPFGSWVFISGVLSSSLESSQSSHLTPDSGSEPSIGHEYREIIKHLERGIKYTPNLPWDEWSSLFQLLVSRATEETGEAGCAIGVVEPLSKMVFESLSVDARLDTSLNTLKCGIELISAARQPRDRQALDAARRRLWGTSVAGSRSASFDPFDYLYRLTNRLLETAYEHMGDLNHGEVVVLVLKEVLNFLTRSSQVLVYKSLVQLQQGLGLWVQDANGRYGSRQSSTVSEAAMKLWDRICSLFEGSGSLDNFQLDAIEPLLCSAFRSKHRHMVNTISTIWNQAFEQADKIEYPETLKEVLISLQPYVDIVLPGLEVSSYEPRGQQQQSFVASQDDLSALNTSPNAGQQATPQTKRLSSRHSITPESVQLSLSTKRWSETTPRASQSKSTRRSGSARLRHDDSQIQFAAIESSSPIGNAVESQVLTDRQKEVRERQQENAALFPTIRSSIEKANSISKSAQPPQRSDIALQVRATTPEGHRSFEDYISSTPTPRRGQTTIIDDDHEMTDDVPSSPPEPRRILLPEMRSRSRSNSMLEDYQISSSPVLGSPLHARQLMVQAQNPADQDSPSKAQEDIIATEPDSEPILPTEQVSEDGSQCPSTDADIDLSRDESLNRPSFERPGTPPNMHPPKAQETPISANTEFVDAPTSSAQHSSRILRSNTAKRLEAIQAAGLPPNSRSFDVSDGEERSMARLVIEIDSRKRASLSNDNIESPDKAHKAGSHAMDSITVNTKSETSHTAMEGSQSSEASSAIPSTPTDAEDTRLSSKELKTKRKRVSEKNQDSGSKKRRYRKHANAEGVDAVSDSQIPSACDMVYSQSNALVPGEVDVPMEDNDDKPDKDISPNPPRDASGQEVVPKEQGSQETWSMDEDIVMDSESEAINLQLIAEASQQSEAGLAAKERMEADLLPANSSAKTREEAADEEIEEDAEVVVEGAPASSRSAESEVPKTERSSFAKIMGSLEEGLEGLRSASLSRHEVYKIEDMFYDIKRELYEAERRSRG
ncbi:Rap1-interacting factor 1 N terminal-domain-containing protein [Biscogniauxia marginata]|nr:Rap1-interacting factor 1 N terminal-domain-containing protein [Biscogniauxia marginata]